MEVKKFITKTTKEIRKTVGDEKVLVACSGGVDSVTCAILGHKALGKKLLAIFIDDGLMREGEPQAVTKILRKFGVKTKLVRVRSKFFKALKKKADPERKRKAFRDTFYKVLGQAVKTEKAKFLIQGTIKADIIETQGGVKTQHNVLEQIGIDPQKYGLKVLEPLKELFKPEVRQVAKTLGLPQEVSERMPFPGPGLATRIVGEVTPRRVKIVRQATKIIEKELEKLKPFQAFAVLLADKATGIKGGKRAFGNIIVIRCVNSSDAMTAKPSHIPFELLQKIQEDLTKIPSIVRVCYDLTPKPPATIEYI
ncbi:glutamine-hydrolyzing GMP synthase subunit GuaA [Candidatus Shapirobacteria bacterium]|nr:glutamine-hydrolyzing GMP synthase subunit GuaA [Candidatus Shapirobacteria bacterium]